MAILLPFWVPRREPGREAEADKKKSPKKGVGELEDEGKGGGNGSCYKVGKKRKK